MAKIGFIKKVSLKQPIETKAEPITEINFRKPKSKDLRGIVLGQAMTMGQLLDIAGSISDLPTSILINELSIEDIGQVTGVVDGFLESFQETGPQPLER